MGIDINKTNVPNIRLAFRHDLLMGELNIIDKGNAKVPLNQLVFWFFGVPFIGIRESELTYVSLDVWVSHR